MAVSPAARVLSESSVSCSYRTRVQNQSPAGYSYDLVSTRMAMLRVQNEILIEIQIAARGKKEQGTIIVPWKEAVC